MAYVLLFPPFPADLIPLLIEVMGRLDHLVDAVYERFKDRFFPGESTCQCPLSFLFTHHPPRSHHRSVRYQVCRALSCQFPTL
jgi:hypothetical protein